MTDEICEMPRFTLVAGKGNYDRGLACILSAAVAYERLKHGESMGDATDRLDCCCDLLRLVLIDINDSFDWNSHKERTRVLSPFIPRLAGTKQPGADVKRAFILANWILHRLADRLKNSGSLPDSLTTVCEGLQQLDTLSLDLESNQQQTRDRLKQWSTEMHRWKMANYPSVDYWKALRVSSLVNNAYAVLCELYEANNQPVVSLSPPKLGYVEACFVVVMEDSAAYVEHEKLVLEITALIEQLIAVTESKE